jgi:peptidoglycan/LPS O-acetylase OafA/YrhL
VVAVGSTSVAHLGGPLVDRSGAPRPKRLPHTPALDGLRGLAIAAVALFHYPTHSVVMGGLFGVGIFFVLSGFLITTILEGEHARRGQIRVAEFLRRRAWRLLPALVAFLLVMLAATAAFGDRGWFTSDPFRRVAPGSPLSVGGALKGMAAAITYTYNLFLAHSSHMPPPFGHLWTLAVEGQFYILWAVLLAWLLPRGRAVLMGATVILIGLSAVSPFVMWDNGHGQNWIYFDTIPRIQQLLAGSLLAQLWSASSVSRVPAWMLRVAAGAGGAVMAWMIFGVATNVRFKYLGSLTVVAAAGTFIIAYLVDERVGGAGGRALSVRPLVWLGQRSYAVYLWHWPLAEWTNLLPHPVGVPLGLGGSLVAAELSWRLVERPAQRLQRFLSERRFVQAEVGRRPG